jgi:hypothetical protein
MFPDSCWKSAGLKPAVQLETKSEERTLRSQWFCTSEGVQFVQKVQIVQPPPSSSPATRGRKEVGELNGAKRLNGLNILNQDCRFQARPSLTFGQ